MQYIGYKSRKHAMTVLTQGQKKQKRKKKGRLNCKTKCDNRSFFF